MYNIIMPSLMDSKNREIYQLFQPVVLERISGEVVAGCKITIEAGLGSEVCVQLDTYEKNQKPTRKCITFSSVDIAVVEVGRLAHNKMCQGFRNCPAHLSKI